MQTVLIITLLATLTVTLSGCATKNYGRLSGVTDYEKRSLTCREINIEIARTEGFVQKVDTESQFDGRSVLSFLGDYGIGNVIEKNGAVNSADERMAALQVLRKERCVGALTVAVAISPGQPTIPGTVVEKGGESSATAERLARQASCVPLGTAVLIGKMPGVENYRVDCEDGQQALVKCEMRQCRVLE
ncbi:hypothetical protein [Glaciimonas immobilis]|uniref:Uncharacterized protein n=1 Tax=Glaciimonas immobilis TaxID=728004 RepID=A0A840RL26_9BURK|nr:hypothetical protein [Glaciimonas immobilis]MBB5198473.1 hypothetical protein [Glaciimonas immobilis]